MVAKTAIVESYAIGAAGNITVIAIPRVLPAQLQMPPLEDAAFGIFTWP